MSAEENKAIVRRWVDAFNEGNVDAERQRKLLNLADPEKLLGCRRV
jgi:hypothetical protein